MKRVNLPKDRNIRGIRQEDLREVTGVASFIEKIKRYSDTHRGDNCIFVYRGEPDIYERPCQPNIFRKQVIGGNVLFEKNLFDAMRQNKLTDEKRYLDNAIDAQHGEFPSRLLDVSYNCLTALYFAVTPYYRQPADSMDNKDGMVFVFFIDEIFSPTSQNLNDNYDAVIKRNRKWYAGQPIFQKNHKFVDHSKLNDRIVAQQGAFLLFQGDEAEDIPPYMSYGIRIPAATKATIRRELKQLFGIHTGSIYPEIVNLAEEMSDKGKRLNSMDFCCKNELWYAVRRLEKELEYYLEYAIDQKHTGAKNMGNILMHIEHVVKSYRDGLLRFYREVLPTNCKGDIDGREFEKIVSFYNSQVEAFAKELQEHGVFEFSCEALKIKF